MIVTVTLFATHAVVENKKICMHVPLLRILCARMGQKTSARFYASFEHGALELGEALRDS